MSGTESLRRSMTEADALAGRWLKRAVAAERECVQLRADNDRWREQGTAWVDKHVALARENDQLRAERDQALALLRDIRIEFGDRHFATLGEARRRLLDLIDVSGLLDDEGQQR